MLALASPSNAAFGVEQMWGVGGGAGGLGLGAGQLTTPQVAAIAPNGEIYVAEYEDCSIRVYSSGGQALRQWGGTCADYAGDPGLYRPISLAVDDRGRAWVGELGNGRISVFDEDGRLLTRIGYGTGTFDNFFAQVTSLDVRSTVGGVELYVADAQKHRVSKFVVDDPVAPDPPDPQFAWTAGTDVDAVAIATGFEVCTVEINCQNGVADAATDSMANVADIDLTPDSATLVAAGNYRYAVNLNATTGAHQSSVDLGASHARQVAPAVGGGYWAAQYGFYSQLFGFDAGGVTTGSVIGSASASAAPGDFSLPLDVTTDASSSILVTDTDMHRVSLFNSAGNFVRAFGKSDGIGWQRGSDDSEFALPRDITVTPSGGFWVADYGNSQIKGFTNAGAAYASNDTATSGTLGGQFSYPSGVAASADGFYLYVADTINRRVQRLDVSGGGAPVFQRMRGKDVYIYTGTGSEICVVAADCKAGVAGTGAGEFSYPLDVEISPFNGEVAVVDGSPGNQIQFFDASLSYLRTVTGGTTAFNNPVSIAFEAANGRFWVVDQNNGRIGHFEPNGTLIGWLQVHGTPSGVAVLGSELHVAQAGFHRVAVYDLSTSLLASWPPPGGYVKPEPTRTYGALGSNRGQLYKPERITAFGSDVLVADTGNSRIVRFGDDAAAANNQISITAPVDFSTVWNRSSEVIEYTATDADGNALTCSPGSGSAVPLNPPGGGSTIVVTCDDPLSAAPITSQVTVMREEDFDAPVISDLLPASGTVTATPQVDVSYSVTDADSSPDCDPASGSTVALSPGVNTLSVTCTDFLGNTATASTLVTYNPPSPPGGGGTPPPGADPDPVATIKLAKLKKFKGSVSATVTCDRACPLVFTVTAKVGRKTYKARATKQLAAAGATRLTAKFKRSATKAILAARKKPKINWALTYGAKAGLSGAVKQSK